MPFSPLSGLLNFSARKRGISSQVAAAMALEFFNQIAKTFFDEEMMKSMKVLHLKDKIITVAVLAPALAQELKLREPQILKYINEKMGGDAVEGLRFLS